MEAGNLSLESYLQYKRNIRAWPGCIFVQTESLTCIIKNMKSSFLHAKKSPGDSILLLTIVPYFVH